MRWSSRLASVGASLAIAAVLAASGLGLMPPQRWLTTFWPRWSASLGLTLLFTLACLALGLAVLERLTPTAPRDGELALSLACGVALFGLALAALGLAQALTPACFWLLPLSALAVGLGPLVRWGQREADRWRRERAPFSLAELALLAGGVLAVALLVTQVLNPDNLNFDSRWYHLRAAQRYALAQGMVRTPEGDSLMTIPQLGSWLYTWAMMAPLPTLTDRLQLALHLELASVLATLAAVPPLTRALFPRLPRAATRLAWVALFGFPSLFIYDNGLFGGSDHLAALWSVPMVLAWLQARSRADLHSWVLWGVLATGALAKHTSLLVLVPVALVAAVDWALNFQKASPLLRLGPFLAGATTLGLAAPWWLRNWIYYRDPIYPLAAGLFPATPWTEDAAAQLARAQVQINFTLGGLPAWGGEGTLAGTAQAVADHWLRVYTWADFTGGQPAFGFLFVVAVVALPFLRGTRLAWLTVGLAVAGLALWFNLKHELRYLTMLTPLMAAVVAGVAATLWASGRPELRAAVVAGAVVQLLVFGDLPFRRTHRMNGHRSPVEAGLDVLARPSAVSGPEESWAGLNAALPPGAVPLVHGTDLPLGLERQSVTDISGLQFGLSYGRLGTVAGVYDRLRELGVTHLIWTFEMEQLDSLAGEVLFRALASQTMHPRAIGHRTVGELPARPPPPLGTTVLYVGCPGLYPTGLYALPDLAEVVPNWPLAFPVVTPRHTAIDWRTLLPHTTWIVSEAGCQIEPGGDFVATGVQVGPRRAWRHFQRVQGVEAPW